jgi:hypothetical protein
MAPLVALGCSLQLADQCPLVDSRCMWLSESVSLQLLLEDISILGNVVHRRVQVLPTGYALCPCCQPPSPAVLLLHCAAAPYAPLRAETVQITARKLMTVIPNQCELRLSRRKSTTTGDLRCSSRFAEQANLTDSTTKARYG